MAQATPGNKKVLYFRDFEKRDIQGLRLAFQTSHTLSGEGDSDSTVTKDGNVSVASAFAWTLSVENLSSEIALRDTLVEVAEKVGTIEIWEVDFSKEGTKTGTYKGKYMRGSVSSIETANDADASATDSVEIAVTGNPQAGDITIDPATEHMAQYVFEDIKAVTAPSGTIANTK